MKGTLRQRPGRRAEAAPCGAVVLCLLLLFSKSEQASALLAMQQPPPLPKPESIVPAVLERGPARLGAVALPAEVQIGCLPRYDGPQWLLTVRDAEQYEPKLAAADLNGDGLQDAAVLRVRWQTQLTWPLDVLVNDGRGSLRLATPAIYVGQVPTVQDPRVVVTADFNGDSRTDLFVGDEGCDAAPHPGYQNTLVLSSPGGKLIDATSLLPQRSDMTHSAAAADVDGDEDIDLYVGNVWGQNEIDPELLLNRGGGAFEPASDHLPPSLHLGENGYTTCEFADVNNDGSPDLILGDAGDDIQNEYSSPDSVVMLNDGAGRFALHAGAMPPKRFSLYDIAHDILPTYIDDDGYVDLILVYEGWTGPGEGWQGSYLQVLINNGDGTFREETDSRIQPIERRVWIPTLELRDITRDGHLDLLCWPWDPDDPDPIVFAGDGRGRFLLQEMVVGLTYLYATFLDIEGDGGHDIVMASFAPPESVFLYRDRGCPLFLPMILRKSGHAA